MEKFDILFPTLNNRHFVHPNIEMLPRRAVLARREHYFMLDSIQSLLDAFPEGAIQIREGAVLSANAMARNYLPELTAGAPLPPCVILPEGEETGAGSFTAGDICYTYSCASNRDGQLLLFRPAAQTALTGRQLTGALQQLRTLLGEVMAEVGPATAPGGKVPAADFSKSMHRLFRLIGNLDYLDQAAGEAGVSFRPVTMDLAGLCWHTVRLAGPLLKEAGVALELKSSSSSMLIPGDPELLQKLLLTLVSNAARESNGVRVVLTRNRQANRALVTVSGSGGKPSGRQLTSLFQRGPGEGLPLPGQGAGLGMSIAQDIVSLHRGTLLTQWGNGALAVTIGLPTGPLNGRASVHTPTAQRDGGLDPVLMELSDLLPSDLFGMEELD